MTKAEIKNIIASLRDGIEYATEQLQSNRQTQPTLLMPCGH